MGFIENVDFWLRLETLWHLLIENPVSVMLTAILGGIAGWFLRKFVSNKPRVEKYGLAALLAVVLISLASIKYYRYYQIEIVSKPEMPWLESPKNRVPNKDWAIKISIHVHSVYKDAHVELLDIYRFSNNSWGNSLNSDVQTRIGWYAIYAFDPKEILPDTTFYVAPFTITDPNGEMRFQYDNRLQAPEIRRWASLPIATGKYKVVMALLSSNKDPVFFTLFVDWFGKPEGIDMRVADVH